MSINYSPRPLHCFLLNIITIKKRSLGTSRLPLLGVAINKRNCHASGCTLDNVEA